MFTPFTLFSTFRCFNFVYILRFILFCGHAIYVVYFCSVHFVLRLFFCVHVIYAAYSFCCAQFTYVIWFLSVFMLFRQQTFCCVHFVYVVSFLLRFVYVVRFLPRFVYVVRLLLRSCYLCSIRSAVFSLFTLWGFYVLALFIFCRVAALFSSFGCDVYSVFVLFML